RGCPVRTECLDHALTYPERHGIWGGLDEDERDRIRKNRREARRRAAAKQNTAGRGGGRGMTQIKHGYTLADLDDMARAAVAVDRLLVGDAHYRHSIAYSAIAEALYASEEPPDRAHLIRVGWQAIAL